MRVTVKKWGNSAAIRLPAAVMAGAKVELDQAVDIREERGRIIIEPVRAPDYDLQRLIDGITDDNRHGEVESGKPIGKERL